MSSKLLEAAKLRASEYQRKKHTHNDTDSSKKNLRDTCHAIAGVTSDTAEVSGAKSNKGNQGPPARPIPKKSAEGMPPALEKAVRELNNQYFQILSGGKLLVANESHSNTLATAMALQTFHQWQAGNTADGKSVSQTWANWRGRRQFDGFTYNPSEPRGAVGNLFNTYLGTAVKPCDKGDCQLIIDHLKEVWCGSDEKQAGYCLNWMAQMFQQPGRKPGAAIVLQSGEGTGKSIITELLSTLWGVEQSTVITNDAHLTGDYNSELFGKMLISIEEASIANNRRASDIVKALVTDPFIQINPKYLGKFKAPHHARVITTTNHLWAIASGHDARRWFIPDISSHRAKDFAYFSKLAEQTTSQAGQAAFLHYLLNRDISSFKPTEIPITRASAEQKRQTADHIDAVTSWLAATLEAGEFEVQIGTTGRRQTEPWDANEGIPRDFVRASYEDYAKKGKHGAPKWRAAVLQMRKLIHDLKDTRPRIEGRPQRRYLFPDLDRARTDFERKTGLMLSLDENEEEG